MEQYRNALHLAMQNSLNDIAHRFDMLPDRDKPFRQSVIQNMRNKINSMPQIIDLPVAVSLTNDAYELAKMRQMVEDKIEDLYRPTFELEILRLLCNIDYVFETEDEKRRMKNIRRNVKVLYNGTTVFVIHNNKMYFLNAILKYTGELLNLLKGDNLYDMVDFEKDDVINNMEEFQNLLGKLIQDSFNSIIERRDMLPEQQRPSKNTVDQLQRWINDLQTRLQTIERLDLNTAIMIMEGTRELTLLRYQVEELINDVFISTLEYRIIKLLSKINFTFIFPKPTEQFNNVRIGIEDLKNTLYFETNEDKINFFDDVDELALKFYNLLEYERNHLIAQRDGIELESDDSESDEDEDENGDEDENEDEDGNNHRNFISIQYEPTGQESAPAAGGKRNRHKKSKAKRNKKSIKKKNLKTKKGKKSMKKRRKGKKTRKHKK